MLQVGHHRGAGRLHFSRPPMQSYRFWVETLFLLMVASEALFFMVFFRSRLSGEAIAYMIFPLAALALLWLGVLRAHQAVYEAYDSEWNTPENVGEKDPRVETLLDNLAYLSYAGFTFASVAVAFVYVALAQSIAIAHP